MPYDSENNSEKKMNEEFETDVNDKNPLKPEKSSTYVNNEEQYNELHSSAITFFVVSIFGILFLVLNFLGVFSFLNGAFSYSVMGILFVAFILIGISTQRKASIVKTAIEEENKRTAAIKDWLLKKVTKEILDELLVNESIDGEEIDSEEIYFLQATDKMKEMIQEEFGMLNENYLDRLVEEFYNDHLED